MPAANNNNNNNSRGGGENDATVPSLIGQFEAFDSDDDDDGGRRRANDQDDDDDDCPALLLRPDDGSSTQSSGDENTGDEDDSVPSLEVPRDDEDSDEDDDDWDEEEEDHNEDEDDDSIPDLVDRNQDNYDSSQDSEQSDLEDPRAVPARTPPPPPPPPRARAAQSQQRQQRQPPPKEQHPYQKQAIRVSYWAELIDTASAMSVRDLKVALQNLRCPRNRMEALLEKSELVLEYAKLRSRQFPVPDPPGCEHETLTPERSQRLKELLRRGIFPDDYADDDDEFDRKAYIEIMQNEFDMASFFFEHEEHELTNQEIQDLFVYLHLQRDEQAWRPRHIQAWRSINTPNFPSPPVPDDPSRLPSFRLRWSLREEHGRITRHCRTHRQLTREYMYAQREKQAAIPIAIPAQNPSIRGTWIVAAPLPNNPTSQWNLTYVWTDGTTIVTSPNVYTTLHPDAGDQVVPGSTPGSVWVYYSRCRPTKGKELQPITFAMDLVRCEASNLRIPVYHNLPRATQLVISGQDRLWLLAEPNDENNVKNKNNNKKAKKTTDNSNEMAQLVLYDRDHLHGHFTGFIVDHRTTRLFPDVVQGGVWVWVRDRTTTGFGSPGLWYVSTTGARWGPAAVVGSKDDPEDEIKTKNGVTTAIAGAPWLLASDSSRQGLWLLGPAISSNRSRLVHVTAVADTKDGWKLVVRQQLVDAQLDQVQSILDDGTTPDAALLHCKTTSEWKLMRAALGQSELVEQYNCTKNAKIVTTGTAAPGVWVLKKTGRRGLHWGLQYLHPTETVEESTGKYVANSILCGGVVAGTTAASG